MSGGLAGPATYHGMSSVAIEGELASLVPTAGAPFLGATGAPVLMTEFGSLVSHFENSEVTLMANAGATASPVSQTASNSFTGPTINPGRPSVASAGKLSSNVATPVTLSRDFLGTHCRVAERTRLFPVREDSGKYFGDWADLALRQAHKNTRFRVVRAAGA